MLIKKILVPTDFSVGSDIALDQALELAKKLDAHLTLFHAYELPVPITVDSAFYLSAEVLTGIERSAHTALDAATDEARRRWTGAPSDIDAVLAIGPIAMRIVEEAERGKFDLIVMGTHGRTGLKHLFIGSVAERVVRTAGCPVLTVRGALGMGLPHDLPAAEIARSTPAGANVAGLLSK